MIHDVCPANELIDGELRTVAVGPRTIGLLRHGTEVVAFHDRCPHQGAPICTSGRLRPLLSGESVGDVRSEPGRRVLVCPWHGWEFEASTGRALAGSPYRLKLFAARIEAGRVLVELGAT